MEMIQVGYAKTHFSALLGRVAQGEALAIAKRGKVVAKLVPVQAEKRTAAQALQRVWAMGGFDLPDQLDTGTPPPINDVRLD